MDHLKWVFRFEICLCFAHFRFGICTLKADKKKFLMAKSCLSKHYTCTYKTALHDKDADEFYLILFSGFTDSAPPSSCHVCNIFKHIKSYIPLVACSILLWPLTLEFNLNWRLAQIPFIAKYTRLTWQHSLHCSICIKCHNLVCDKLGMLKIPGAVLRYY